MTDLSPCFEYQHSNMVAVASSQVNILEDSLNAHQQDTRHTNRKHKRHKKYRTHTSCSKSDETISGSENVYDNGKKSDEFDNMYMEGCSGDHSIKGHTRRELEEMPDLSWLTDEITFTEIDLLPSNECTATDSNIELSSSELSQRTSHTAEQRVVIENATNDQDERAILQEKIRKKCIELEAMIGTTNAKKHRNKRRRNYQLRKYDNTEMCGSDELMPRYVNVRSIIRTRRSAQPIREALLVRTAMNKAWKGLLGSCCGKGCWATWKWINLRRVISDYE